MSATLAQDKQKKMTEVLADAEGSSGRVRFTFYRTSFVEILYLLGMNRGGVLKLKEADAATLSAINTCRDWGPDANRKVEIQLTGAFSASQFTDRMARACESIELVK